MNKINYIKPKSDGINHIRIHATLKDTLDNGDILMSEYYTEKSYYVLAPKRNNLFQNIFKSD